ncbi:MAG TPA: glucose-6-phosphate isomerase [Planctomycetes bacterium]|nr:glucose-6-phosphate isomerase [Planctomycetota bacterium]
MTTPIRFDFTNVLADAVGPEGGLAESDLAGLAGASRTALAAVLDRRDKDLRWLDLPFQTASMQEAVEFAASVRGRFKNVCVLGIGGSALGITALSSALSGSFADLDASAEHPRLFVLDNVDPDLIGEFLERVDPTETLFNVISKSGGTAETMSQFLIMRAALIERLGEEKAREHIVCTTDAEHGVLREIVRREGYHSFVVPEGVGGRFSVLSPVGLVPAALIGLDVEALLAGAAAMAERCRTPELFENPALVHAAVQALLHRERDLPMAVMFTYSHRLRHMADWYAQLLAESIGKRVDRSGRVVHRGPTPISAVGVTDQHSQVQLFAEGPRDKWFTFLTVDEPDRDVPIPLAFEDLEGASYLGGKTLAELFQAECVGTRVALTAAGRPNATLSLGRVDANGVGGLIYLLELSVAVMGEHYDVDAFDQPGVEAGKVAAYGWMGRAGYEAERARIEAASGGPRRVV